MEALVILGEASYCGPMRLVIAVRCFYDHSGVSSWHFAGSHHFQNTILY